jgi:hypothetical protein
MVFELTAVPPVALLFSDAVTVPVVCVRVVEAETTPEELTLRPPPLAFQVTKLVIFCFSATAASCAVLGNELPEVLMVDDDVVMEIPSAGITFVSTTKGTVTWVAPLWLMVTNAEPAPTASN